MASANLRTLLFTFISSIWDAAIYHQSYIFVKSCIEVYADMETVCPKANVKGFNVLGCFKWLFFSYI